jgi:hypothetical protein
MSLNEKGFEVDDSHWPILIFQIPKLGLTVAQV